MSYLTDYEEINRGCVAFGGNPKGGKITGKCTIRTSKLDFENMYFVRELKFNLFSVSQICDKKNSVLFNDTECIVLSPNFKLIDESQVLLRVPRKNNMYSVALKNIVPKEGLTCLFAKATSDESKIWHRRLGNLNFKTMNKLFKGNLVRGLPSKLFENNQDFVACQKGKQHRAPFVTDDYSRFTWVFFLASKDETSAILKTFITRIENLVDHKVKVIRCDNGTEFKNREMNQFCEMKGIMRQYSVARTPQQNRVAKKRNRTLIKAARTMLADSKLPTTFSTEVVNTACNVQNRVLVVKPYSKTSYEVFHGRTPALSFIRPFGYLVAILNTKDHLGKFDDQKKKDNVNNTNNVNAVGINGVNTVSTNTNNELPFDPKMPALEDISTFNFSSDHEDDVEEADMNNMDTTIQVNPTLNIRIHKDYPIDQVIGDLHSTTQTRNISKNLEDHCLLPLFIKEQTIKTFKTIYLLVFYHKKNPKRIEAIRLFLAYASFKDFVVYQMDVKSAFLYEKIKEEVYVYQPQRFENPDFPDKVYIVEKALYGLHQAPRACQDKYVAEILKKYGFFEVKNASTRMETQNPLLKDEDGEEVDVHVYRSMIGSLIYLTSLRPDIMFAMCVCARYQINPKVSHLHAVKRIFRLISWKCKKQTVVANSTTEAEYVSASSCCRQVKENQEKDKIGSKLDKNGKRGDTRKCQKQLQSIKQEKLKKVDEDPRQESKCKDQENKENVNNTNNVNAASKNRVNVVGVNTNNELSFDPEMPSLKDISTFNYSSDHEDAIKEQTIKTFKIIYLLVFYHKKNPKRVHKGKIDKTLFIRKYKDDILLVQVYVDEIIVVSTKKELCNAFEKMMHEKFQMSSMGELTFFIRFQVKQKQDRIFISQDKYIAEILKKYGLLEVKNASLLMETQKPLLKDKDGEEVNVHMYRSMIGSLMYLTSSRLDIMFAVCACARYQVIPKVSHLHAVKSIFRYLKGQPKFGLWYPKDSPFDLVAYTDSDYVGASLDRKSKTGRC
uniref:Uncharacterized mitochondrial protein AtMg00810-like n=1 Tax=Tanacetum cinerariifolium TaxID=118510 RepID=A0A699GWE5_TANCI|nr:uncharacterized mitochondrial protein AtMg00810-like [Tanacetum cinerariifolium]